MERLYLVGEESFENGGYQGDMVDREVPEEYLTKIPSKYQTVIRCIVIDEMSVKEAARYLEISESAVRKRYERARKMLRDVMNGENTDE